MHIIHQPIHLESIQTFLCNLHLIRWSWIYFPPWSSTMKLIWKITRPGYFCAKDCLGSDEMYPLWYTRSFNDTVRWIVEWLLEYSNLYILSTTWGQLRNDFRMTWALLWQNLAILADTFGQFGRVLQSKTEWNRVKQGETGWNRVKQDETGWNWVKQSETGWNRGLSL